MKSLKTLGEILSEGGVSRRGFLKFCAATASLMALPPAMVPAIAQALDRAKRPSVIWLSFQECTGCTESLTRSFSPTVEDLILGVISLDYHHTLQAASGEAAEEARRRAMEENRGAYLVVVDGSLPGPDSNPGYSTIAGHSNYDILMETVEGAAAVVAVGTCAAFGGLPHAAPNPTGAVAVHELITDKPVINVSGCPPVPMVITGVLAQYLTFGQLPALDSYGRPLAYWLRQRHPGDVGMYGTDRDRLVRVPADQMMHLYVADRWPQRRGEPWLHTAAKRLHDMDGYSEAEIVAARGAASYMGIIESPEPDNLGPDSAAADAGQYEAELEPGMIRRLAPGETFKAFDPSRPNGQMDPFMRMMLREVAAGAGVSYESLSRDYSQSNYSSSRLALLDDRDVWRVLQQWFVTTFREPLHRIWMQQAMLARAIPSISVDEYMLGPRKFDAVAFKPRGWSWVDPTKEVQAFKEAVRAGFTTVTDVIAQTAGGMDIEDVMSTRRRELDLMDEMQIAVDTVPQDPAASTAAKPMRDDAAEPENNSGPARIVPIRG